MPRWWCYGSKPGSSKPEMLKHIVHIFKKNGAGSGGFERFDRMLHDLMDQFACFSMSATAFQHIALARSKAPMIDWFRQASKTNISCEVISKWLIWGPQYQATVSLFFARLGTCLHGQNLSGLQVCGLVGFASNCFTVWGPTESACTRMEDLLIPNASQSSKLVHVSPSKKSLEDNFYTWTRSVVLHCLFAQY